MLSQLFGLLVCGGLLLLVIALMLLMFEIATTHS